VPYVNPCTDGVRDGYETGVDCGGGICAGCPLGSGCAIDSDCASAACDAIARVCIGDQCADNRLDGNETDVDCGGPTACQRCDVGLRCRVDSDCVPGRSCTTGNPHVCL
jgi:hypothetical protein